MASEVLKGDFLNVTKSTKSSGASTELTSQSKKETNKETISLFDQLLQGVKDSKTPKTEQKDTNTLSTQNKTDSTANLKGKLTEKTQVLLGSKNIKQETTNSKQMPSLLDKMINDIESKTIQTKNDNLDVSLENDKKSKIVVNPKAKDINSDKTSSPLKNETLKDNTIILKETKKEEKNKEDTKINPQTKTKVDVENLVQTTQTKSIHQKDVKILKENISVKTEIYEIKEERKNKLSPDKKIHINTKDSETIKESVDKKDEAKESSLMDKMLTSIKKDAKNEDAENENIKDAINTNDEKKKQSSLMDNILEKIDTNVQLTDKDKSNNIFQEKQDKNEPKKSLMDTMLHTIKSSEQKNVDEKEKINITKEKNTVSISEESQSKDSSGKIPSNGEQKQLLQVNKYLHEQKKSRDLVSKNAQHEAKEVMKEKPSLEGTKKAADILELDAKDMSIETQKGDELPKEIEKKSEQFVFKKSYSVLNRVYLKENLTEDKFVNDLKTSEIKSSEEKEVATKISESPSVDLHVEQNQLEVFTSKIIASKQKIDSVMSDVAKQMYQNYKPPVTAFRINLNPANLGSIAIVIKSNKSENSLSINMNLNQSNTYEVMSENKSSLQQAIVRNFTNETSIGLDLSFNENSNNQFESMYDDQQKKKQENTNGNISTTEKEEDLAEIITSEYM